MWSRRFRRALPPALSALCAPAVTPRRSGTLGHAAASWVSFAPSSRFSNRHISDRRPEREKPENLAARPAELAEALRDTVDPGVTYILGIPVMVTGLDRINIEKLDRPLAAPRGRAQPGPVREVKERGAAPDLDREAAGEGLVLA
jgi:hypothetical protein